MHDVSRYSYDSQSLLKDGDRLIPVMGEVHYSRLRREDWQDAIRKMKAGGIHIISCYVIWIHHEEIEGQVSFRDNLDIRSFVELCQQEQLEVFIRIGPWCHGEVRNGGFPDWLLNKGFEARSNDENYFKEVKRFYQYVFEQVKGLFNKDGGPIMGIQIENEYGHAGGLSGEAGEAHMIRLKEMAQAIGYDVPYYTATGWGGACTGGMMPVYGGYCDAPWDRSLDKLPPNENYQFRHDRNDGLIANDYVDEASEGISLTKTMTKYPYLTCEIGGGLQMTWHRRPHLLGSDIGSFAWAKLGSGANMLGYYMYHGGTNPKGQLSTMQESIATGSPNDYPVFSYDFQAPVLEFGQKGPAYDELRLITMFLDSYGSELASSQTIIPEDQSVRHSLRVNRVENGYQGYLFVNNYVRLYPMEETFLSEIVFDLSGKTYRIDLSNHIGKIDGQSYGCYPIAFNDDGEVTAFTHATPLCQLKQEQPMEVMYVDDTNKAINDSVTDIYIITKEEALKAHKISYRDKEYLIFYDGFVLQHENQIDFIGKTLEAIQVFPECKELVDAIDIAKRELPEEHELTKVSAEDIDLLEMKDQHAIYEIDLSAFKSNKYSENTILYMDFEGDQIEVYIDDVMVHDNFKARTPYAFALKNYEFPKKIRVKIKRLEDDKQIYVEDVDEEILHKSQLVSVWVEELKKLTIEL